MDWAKAYYTHQSRTFGRAVVSDRHRAIAADFDRGCRDRGGARRVLELGAGAGGLAAGMADLGYDVWAIEFNPSCADLAR